MAECGCGPPEKPTAQRSSATTPSMNAAELGGIVEFTTMPSVGLLGSGQRVALSAKQLASAVLSTNRPEIHPEAPSKLIMLPVPSIQAPVLPHTADMGVGKPEKPAPHESEANVPGLKVVAFGGRVNSTTWPSNGRCGSGHWTKDAAQRQSIPAS